MFASGLSLARNCHARRHLGLDANAESRRHWFRQRFSLGPDVLSRSDGLRKKREDVVLDPLLRAGASSCARNGRNHRDRADRDARRSASRRRDSCITTLPEDSALIIAPSNAIHVLHALCDRRRSSPGADAPRCAGPYLCASRALRALQSSSYLGALDRADILPGDTSASPRSHQQAPPARLLLRTPVQLLVRPPGVLPRFSALSIKNIP